MKRLWRRGLVAGGALLLLTGALSAQEENASDVAKMLEQIEERWGAAIAEEDADALDNLIADDWMMVGPDGKMRTKAEILAETRSGEYQVATYTTGPMTVRVFGETAVVMGSSTEKSTYKGQDVSGEYRWTDVFLKRNGRWEPVASHVNAGGT